MKIRHLIAAFFLVLAPAAASARDSIPLRPVLSAYTAEIGRAHIADTYLSPLKYSGMKVGLNYQRMQTMKFDPDRWAMGLALGGAAAQTFNPVHSARMWLFDFSARWEMLRYWQCGHVRLFGGGNTRLDAGAFYSQRNSNNPVAAKCAWTVGVSAAASYPLKIKKVPVTLFFHTEFPLAGAFFGPEYGELYYEIYLGNHRGLARFAWPGSRWRWDNSLTADFRFGGTTVRLGYRLDVMSSKAGGLVTRQTGHSAVVGFVSEWISLYPLSNLGKNKRIANVLY